MIRAAIIAAALTAYIAPASAQGAAELQRANEICMTTHNTATGARRNAAPIFESPYEEKCTAIHKAWSAYVESSEKKKADDDEFLSRFAPPK